MVPLCWGRVTPAESVESNPDVFSALQRVCESEREGVRELTVIHVPYSLDRWAASQPKQDFIRSSIQIEYDLANENYYT